MAGMSCHGDSWLVIVDFACRVEHAKSMVTSTCRRSLREIAKSRDFLAGVPCVRADPVVAVGARDSIRSSAVRRQDAHPLDFLLKDVAKQVTRRVDRRRGM
jgi:hypothetical protein